MITVRIDGKEEIAFQFIDLLIGDFFRCKEVVGIKIPKSGFGNNAIDLKEKRLIFVPDVEVVEPISLEWEGSEEDDEVE